MSSADYDQGDWSNYEESEDLSIHLLDSDNKTNDSELLQSRK